MPGGVCYVARYPAGADFREVRPNHTHAVPTHNSPELRLGAGVVEAPKLHAVHLGARVRIGGRMAAHDVELAVLLARDEARRRRGRKSRDERWSAKGVRDAAAGDAPEKHSPAKREKKKTIGGFHSRFLFFSAITSTLGKRT